jgi:hypothetical protein
VTGTSDIVWDRLVAQLSRGFYVINNIDKVSRLINVSFYSDSPDEYIDCGTTTRTYTRGSESHTYSYPLAESSSFKTGEKRSNGIITFDWNRTTKLEGTLSLNTNQPNTTQLGTPGEPTYVTCYSRGNLKGQIIEFAKHN